MSPLTDQEAKEMMEKLKLHFGEPVMPVSNYCDALRTWARCIVEANKRGPEYPNQAIQGSAYHGVLWMIIQDAEKSGLLARLIYGGEKKRERVCPEHGGHMNTFIWVGGAECAHGCQGSGWLPEE